MCRDLNSLEYMELVIKETLRLYPSVSFIGRRVTEDTEISEQLKFWVFVAEINVKFFYLDGKLLPKDSDLSIPILFMGKNPKSFENPHIFWPERFEAVRGNEINNPYNYIPFSAGKKFTMNCPNFYFNKNYRISKLHWPEVRYARDEKHRVKNPKALQIEFGFRTQGT